MREGRHVGQRQQAVGQGRQWNFVDDFGNSRLWLRVHSHVASFLPKEVTMSCNEYGSLVSVRFAVLGAYVVRSFDYKFM